MIGVKQKHAKYPCMVIFKMWNYLNKVNILNSQGGKKIKIHGQSIRFIQDLSARLRKNARNTF
jgi:hypothetical protein